MLRGLSRRLDRLWQEHQYRRDGGRPPARQP